METFSQVYRWRPPVLGLHSPQLGPQNVPVGLSLSAQLFPMLHSGCFRPSLNLSLPPLLAVSVDYLASYLQEKLKRYHVRVREAVQVFQTWTLE